jgi:hypothetical protein
MANPYFIQLIGLLLTLAGMIALTASAKCFGTPLTRGEQRSSGQRGNSYSLPINWSAPASGAFFLGGMGMLTWSEFDMCPFLGYWMTNLPEALKLFLSC